MPITFLDESAGTELESFLRERIYEFNAQATGYSDGRLIAARHCNCTGEVVAGFTGHTWGKCCVVANLWVREDQRGHGLGRKMLKAAETEATLRGCEQVVLSTHTFQAPEFYARQGYEKVAEIFGEPKGYSNIVFVKKLIHAGTHTAKAEYVHGD